MVQFVNQVFLSLLVLVDRVKLVLGQFGVVFDQNRVFLCLLVQLDSVKQVLGQFAVG